MRPTKINWFMTPQHPAKRKGPQRKKRNSLTHTSEGLTLTLRMSHIGLKKIKQRFLLSGFVVVVVVVGVFFFWGGCLLFVVVLVVLLLLILGGELE